MDPTQQPGQTPETNPTPTPPASPVAPSPQPGIAQTAGDPGKTLGIVGLVLAFLVPLAGLIVSIIAKSKSKKAGFSNGLALAGIIVSAISMALGILLLIVLMVGSGAALQYCAENPTASECSTSSSSYESSSSYSQ